ncbi:MAG: alpha/beta fold hydrolase [Syntrophobacteraceae bacterium]
MRKLPAILVSGWAHGAEAMEPLARRLRNTHEVSTVSLSELLTEARESNSGASADPEVRPSPYALAIARRINETKEPVCLVGWSTGAMPVVEVAVGLPERIGALVLLSSTARFCADVGYVSGTHEGVLRAMSRGMKRDPETVLGDFFSRAAFPAIIGQEELNRKIRDAVELGMDSLVHGLGYLMHIDLRGALRAISAPCLVVHGNDDRIVPLAAAEFLVRNTPNSVGCFLPNAGHLLIEECEKDVTSRIQDFLEDLS